MTTPPKPIEDTQAIPADIEMEARAIAERICPWSEADEIASFKAAKWVVIAHAILAERQRYEWQPIETAPRDGTAILLYGDMLGEINVDAKGQIGVGSCRYGSFELDNADAYSVDFINPTHWMPLPPAPIANKSPGQ